MKTQLKKMEIWGVLFTFISGTLLHFCYELSNRAVWSILIAAINESVWEHIKIFILPYLFWAIIEICYLRTPMKKTIVAKTIGIYIFSAITILFYYTYSGILGHSISLLDIVSVFIWIILAHYISYKLVLSNLELDKFFTISAFLLTILLAMYLTFSVNPPKLDLFKDPQTGLYGIIPKNVLPSWISNYVSFHS